MNKTCFILSSIGAENSETRKLVDEKYEFVYKPILESCGYNLIRSNEISTEGHISKQIIDHLINSDLVIADISDLNPNVFYELAIRNTLNKPVILITNPNQHVPFDIMERRTISIDMRSPRSWMEAKDRLKNQILTLEENPASGNISILSDVSSLITKNVSNQTHNIQIQNVSVLMNKGKVLSELGEFEKSILYYDKVIDLDPNNVQALVQKGRILENLGNITESIFYFDKALEIEPNNVLTLQSKGETSLKTDQYEQAIKYFDEALEIEPETLEIIHSKGIALSRLNRIEESLELFNRVLKLEPKFLPSLLNKGALLTQIKKFDESLICFNTILEITPNHVYALFGKANVLNLLGKYNEAIACYDKVLKIEPENMVGLSNKGLILTKLGKYNEAITCYDKILEITPNQTTVQILRRSNLAKVLESEHHE